MCGRVLHANHQRSGNAVSQSRDHLGCGYRALKNSAEFASVRGLYNGLVWCVISVFVCWVLAGASAEGLTLVWQSDDIQVVVWPTTCLRARFIPDVLETYLLTDALAIISVCEVCKGVVKTHIQMYITRMYYYYDVLKAAIAV